MFEKDLIKLQRELGEIRQDLLNNSPPVRPGDEEAYQLATKIDLTVSRVLRLMDHKIEIRNAG